MGPISKKVIAGLKKANNQKIIDFKALKEAKAYVQDQYFWNEYIFEGYVNFQEDMIKLAGFPDIPLSMPH